jgi:hypothetical protein
MAEEVLVALTEEVIRAITVEAVEEEELRYSEMALIS